MNKITDIKDKKVKVKSYSSVGKNGIKITVSFTDNEEDDKNSREIIKDFIVREIL
ncbi:hypothetical protein [uncultured Metabacillus sp.]|uniref:hypothetical protein n=1 Tax=uncultured Metabacillus sp. TaxID=2860135 RepID=UPI0026172EE4|nr:hypothetical protein [uncultured Metabacillus sp.]